MTCSEGIFEKISPKLKDGVECVCKACLGGAQGFGVGEAFPHGGVVVDTCHTFIETHRTHNKRVSPSVNWPLMDVLMVCETLDKREGLGLGCMGMCGSAMNPD